MPQSMERYAATRYASCPLTAKREIAQIEPTSQGVPKASTDTRCGMLAGSREPWDHSLVDLYPNADQIAEEAHHRGRKVGRGARSSPD
jgi:hypothetical protein